MDFKQRFGLDYLTTPPNSARSTSGVAPPRLDTALWPSNTSLPQGLNDAVVAYSGKVIGALHRDQSQMMPLFDIAKELSARVDTLLPVMTFLTANGYLEKAIEDPLGNDTFRLTDAGRAIAPETK